MKQDDLMRALSPDISPEETVAILKAAGYTEVKHETSKEQ